MGILRKMNYKENELKEADCSREKRMWSQLQLTSAWNLGIFLCMLQTCFPLETRK